MSIFLAKNLTHYSQDILEKKISTVGYGPKRYFDGVVLTPQCTQKKK